MKQRVLKKKWWPFANAVSTQAQPFLITVCVAQVTAEIVWLFENQQKKYNASVTGAGQVILYCVKEKKKQNEKRNVFWLKDSLKEIWKKLGKKVKIKKGFKEIDWDMQWNNKK